MSFGVGVGDFLAVGTLALKVYKSCKALTRWQTAAIATNHPLEMFPKLLLQLPHYWSRMQNIQYQGFDYCISFAAAAEPNLFIYQCISTARNHSLRQLACKLHSTWIEANYKTGKGSVESFDNISGEVRSLHAVLKECQDTLLGPPPQPDSEESLQVILEGCTKVLNDLQALVDKYESLRSKSKVTLDRMKWCQEDIAEIRARLTSNVTLLTAFIR